MSRELRQLLANLSAVQKEANELMNKDGVTADELTAKLGEIKALQAKIDVQKALDTGKEFDENGVELTGSVAAQKKESKQEAQDAYKGAFVNALRRRATDKDFEVLNQLNPGADADGGLIVPKDVQTAINQYKRTLPALEAYVNVVPVGTTSGTRVFEKIAKMTPLADITDLTADLSDMGNPNFEKIEYNCTDRGGIMPIPNDLLNDTDQNLLAYLSQWMGRKSVVTRNGLILAVLSGLTPVAMADWKAIKKAINVTLDPIFAASATIFTNQDGYQYLDTLTDKQDRPLLQPDVTNPGGNKLFGKPVVVVSNNVLTTAESGSTTKTYKAPLIVGNMQEAVAMFERQGYQVDSTNVGGSAFIRNQTHLRMIEREDVKKIDGDAVVYGQIDVTSVM